MKSDVFEIVQYSLQEVYIVSMKTNGEIKYVYSTVGSLQRQM